MALRLAGDESSSGVQRSNAQAQPKGLLITTKNATYDFTEPTVVETNLTDHRRLAGDEIYSGGKGERQGPKVNRS